MENKKFKYFIPVKTAKSIKLLENGDIDFEFEGRIHEDREDLEGQYIPTKIIDTQNLEKFGRIKYEHNDPNNPGPGNNIGFITEIIRNEKSIDVKGRVFCKKSDSLNYKLAKELVDDLNNLEEWNKKYSDNPRQYGLSLEGPMMVNKSSKQPVKVVASDVVFTTGPINQGSFARAVKKSLSASYNVDPSTMSGADALKKESINSKKSTRHKMKNFKTNEDAFKYYKGQGMTDVDAQEKADAIFAAKEQVSKSLRTGLKHVTDAIKEIENDNAEIEDAGTEVQRIEKSIKKALSSDSKDVDAEEFLRAQGKGVVQNANETLALRKSLNKGMLAILNVQDNILRTLDAMNTNHENGLESVDELSNEVAEIRKSLKKTTTALTQNAPENGEESPGGEGTAALTEVQKVEKITKSLKPTLIRDALVSTGIDKNTARLILGEGVNMEDLTVEIGMARNMNYAYKSLSPNCQKIVDTKLANEINEILKQPAEA